MQRDRRAATSPLQRNSIHDMSPCGREWLLNWQGAAQSYIKIELCKEQDSGYTGLMPAPSVIQKIATIPTSPGIYIYKDTSGKVLYVGKAKNLKNRVRSYFTKSATLGPAKERMMGLIANIETISTDTELEALVLEANLIRKHQPPYNVLLRDDKYYLFIKITKEEQPRIFPVRKIIKDGARYFGPYSSAASVRATLRLLRRIFPFKGEKDTAHDIIFPHPLFDSPPFQGGVGGGERDNELTHPTQPCLPGRQAP